MIWIPLGLLPEGAEVGKAGEHQAKNGRQHRKHKNRNSGPVVKEQVLPFSVCLRAHGLLSGVGCSHRNHAAVSASGVTRV